MPTQAEPPASVDAPACAPPARHIPPRSRFAPDSSPHLHDKPTRASSPWLSLSLTFLPLGPFPPPTPLLLVQPSHTGPHMWPRWFSSCWSPPPAPCPLPLPHCLVYVYVKVPPHTHTHLDAPPNHSLRRHRSFTRPPPASPNDTTLPLPLSTCCLWAGRTACPPCTPLPTLSSSTTPLSCGTVSASVAPR